MSEILQIRRGVSHVDDITNMQHHTYTPHTFAFNNSDEIRITIQSQDLLVLPSGSYILVEFKPVRRDGASMTESDKATFPLYGAMNFFSEIRYELNGIEIDRCKLPSVTSLLKTMVACKESDFHSMQSLLWLHAKEIQEQTYRHIIPLKFIFGFCDDYNKVIVNSKHELVLIRNHSDVIVYNAKEDFLKFNISKIQWKVPLVTLSDRAKITMLKTIEQKEPIPLAFRSWDLHELPNVLQVTRNIWSVKTATQITKPRYVIVAFQTKRFNAVNLDSQRFDHCNVSNIRLYLNNERYPYDDMNINFGINDHCELYSLSNQIQNGYYNGTETSNPLNMGDDIKDKTYTYFAFDCSRSEHSSVRNGMVDIRIEMDARENFPAHTTAYCLIIHDNLVQYWPATGIVQRIVT